VAGIVDTLKTARELHPGKKNSLDALCERYAINNSSRTLHGALLDAELLAEVYLAMTRGQESLGIELGTPAAQVAVIAPAGERIRLVRVTATHEEVAAHERVLEDIRRESKGKLVWAAAEPAPG
jgi:DNA polymerase-3 subunit epsilon